MKPQTITSCLYVITIACLVSCKSKAQEHQEERKGKRPSATELIERMDSNKDSKLSKEEVKGPLQHHFSEVDINSDGYLTKEELENAPKPKGRHPEKH